MHDSKLRHIYILAITALIVLTSFFRDHVFKSINEQLRLNYYKEEFYNYSFLADILQKYSDEGLYNLKFILTLGFSAAFMLLCLFLCKVTFRNRKYNRYVLIAYVFVFLLAAGIYLSGKLTGAETQAYELSREISEFLQSPLLILILMAVFVFDSKRSLTRNT